MINIQELSNKVKEEGYSEEMSEAKLCQDIILLMLSKSKFNKNITIKGGVVMRSISNNIRRATIDIDLDLIKYPLTVDGINKLIKELNGVDGVRIQIVGKIEDLKHQDYSGKRAYVEIKDNFDNVLSSKIDIEIHKYLSLEQDEYCFDITASDEGAALLINSKEQIFTEKLKSLLRFGSLSTRYKDIYDMYYLIDLINEKELMRCFDVLVFNDNTMRENSINDIVNRVVRTFRDRGYLMKLSTSNQNWLGIDNDAVLNGIIEFLSKLA